MALLLVESGSTKTDWCYLQKGKKPSHYKTSGINPNLQSQDEIEAVIKKELKWDTAKKPINNICYYGAGVGTPAGKQQIKKTLSSQFKKTKVEVESDLLAASRGLAGNDKGIICILGTGSNACYYDGNKIKEKLPSLGYIAGDEGSGNHLGKRILQYYAYKTFDEQLRMDFEQRFGNDLPTIIKTLYKEQFPNRYLASFVALLKDNRGHFMVENILEDCLSDFFQHHILKLRKSWSLPIHFTGSVAYEFKDILVEMCGQYELELGKIEKSPLDGLIKYHKLK
jgi:glucosamine kinase